MRGQPLYYCVGRLNDRRFFATSVCGLCTHCGIRNYDAYLTLAPHRTFKCHALVRSCTRLVNEGRHAGIHYLSHLDTNQFDRSYPNWTDSVELFAGALHTISALVNRSEPVRICRVPFLNNARPHPPTCCDRCNNCRLWCNAKSVDTDICLHVCASPNKRKTCARAVDHKNRVLATYMGACVMIVR